MAEIIEIKEADFADKVKNGTVLVDFWAEWCSPCRMYGKILHELAPELPAELQILKVNVDESPALAARFSVTSIPHSILFVNGSPVAERTGVQTRPQLLQLLNDR